MRTSRNFFVLVMGFIAADLLPVVVATDPLILNVLDFGAAGDGFTDDTSAIRLALNYQDPHSVSKIVWLPPKHVFLSQPLNITSNTTLQIDGILKSLNNEPTWPRMQPLPNYNTSEDGPYLQYQSLLYASNAENIIITGSGEVDGNGDWWWENFQNRDNHALQAGRPNLVQTLYCRNIEISHLTFRNSPFWCLHPVLSQNIWIHEVTIRARTYAPNSDGIDPDSCQNVLLEYNDVGCGDDNIAVKSGRCGSKSDHLSCVEDSRFVRGDFVTNNVTIRHNIFRNGMGIAIGSESSGSIRNIHVHNNQVGVCESGHGCVEKSNRDYFYGRDLYNNKVSLMSENNYSSTQHGDDDSCCGWGPGLHVKTTVSRGGVLENITFANNIVFNNTMFLLLEAHYQNHGSDSLPSGYDPVKVRNINLLGNQALGTAFSATFDCPVVSACEGIVVKNNVILGAEKTNATPWSCHNVATYDILNNIPQGLDECMEHSSSEIFSTNFSSVL